MRNHTRTRGGRKQALNLQNPPPTDMKPRGEQQHVHVEIPKEEAHKPARPHDVGGGGGSVPSYMLPRGQQQHVRAQRANNLSSSTKSHALNPTTFQTHHTGARGDSQGGVSQVCVDAYENESDHPKNERPLTPTLPPPKPQPIRPAPAPVTKFAPHGPAHK
jgi:hypothetical protein